MNQLNDIRRLAVVSGVMAAGIAADAEILQFRWPTANVGRLALLHLDIAIAGTATAFAAGNALVRAIRSTAWTASGSGGALATLTNSNAKLDTAYDPAVVPEVRVATTAALGAGTKTFLTEYFSGTIQGVSTSAGDKVLPLTTLFNARAIGDHPMIFGDDEGFSVRVIVPATGTWGFVANMAWGVISN